MGSSCPKPQRTCTPVVAPNVAATAAYALQGVMKSGGTGSNGNPGDGTPLIGKTGTHEEITTWMVESSSRVATATWVGNVEGGGDITKTSYKGNRLNQIRFPIAKAIQRAVDAAYPAGAFDKEDPELTKVQLTDLPSVIGLSVADATAKLEDAGFTVEVGGAVDSDQPEGLVAAQNPGAGKVAGGSTITLSPSNGQGTIRA